MAKPLGILIFLLGFSPWIFAQDYDLSGRFGMGLGAGANQSLNSDVLQNVVDEDFAAGVWFRYHVSTSWAFELAYDHFQYKDNEPKMSNIDMSVAVRLWGPYRWRFLVQAGVGIMQVKEFPNFREENYDAFAAKGRLGVEYMMSKNWAMGLHADYHYADVKKEYAKEIHVLAPMLGFTYYFGGAPEPEDSDGDGVTDDLDKCPDTESGVAVGADGCPVEQEKVVVDSDYDGVPDDKDHCPMTEMGKPVNKLGCTAQEKIEFTLKVQFASGKWNVDDQYKDQLTEFANFMKKYPEVKAEIEGHTDSTGSEQFNNYISNKRAEAVRIYLVNNFGIGADRLTHKGYGPSKPIADNNTVEGRSQNRRVVATVKVE